MGYACGIGKRSELGYGKLIEQYSPLSPALALFNVHCICVFKVCKHKKLFYSRMISHISTKLGVILAPLGGGHSKQSNVQHVCFIGIYKALLVCRYLRRNKIFLYGFRMKLIIGFGKQPFYIPVQSEPVSFIGFKPLIVLDDIQLEFGRYP